MSPEEIRFHRHFVNHWRRVADDDDRPTVLRLSRYTLAGLVDKLDEFLTEIEQTS